MQSTATRRSIRRGMKAAVIFLKIFRGPRRSTLSVGQPTKA